jgi:hypothetical protein
MYLTHLVMSVNSSVVIEIELLHLQPFHFLLVAEWVDLDEIWYRRSPGNFFEQL